MKENVKKGRLGENERGKKKNKKMKKRGDKIYMKEKKNGEWKKDIECRIRKDNEGKENEAGHRGRGWL